MIEAHHTLLHNTYKLLLEIYRQLNSRITLKLCLNKISTKFAKYSEIERCTIYPYRAS